ncbi:hypothetical protein F4813DRAFT_299466 [Daldinia decipiens]|uniref:uncharacterized protein n=1 Tax=Daldinia decipiens TaxID=326647 RepID=UPI0020C417B8|nr:uncharacterized protein F4813DRAFT_299466 [Daldinia decipiens]KAI1660622.1 hypothetical protein F4813DRAFT_299466 [Daldinia decipiens]
MSAQLTEFDRRGDVKLRIGHDHDSKAVVFTVCSRSLARASPVFDRMLYGSFSEGWSNQAKDAEDWIVNLPEDKPAAMAVLLSVTHAHFEQIPKTPSVDELYDLTVLSHFYDVTRTLGPWSNKWMATVEKLERESRELMPKVLWISWEMGWKNNFSALSRRMVLECEAAIFSTSTDQIQYPPDIIERISKIRVQTIRALLDIFGEMIENLAVVDEKPRWCRHAVWMGPHKCESMILGSIIFCLIRAGLWPLPDADEVEESVIAIYSKMTNIIIHDIGAADNSQVDHNECNPGPFLFDRVQAVMGEIPNPVTTLHSEYMEKQVRKFELTNCRG